MNKDEAVEYLEIVIEDLNNDAKEAYASGEKDWEFWYGIAHKNINNLLGAIDKIKKGEEER